MLQVFFVNWKFFFGQIFDNYVTYSAHEIMWC
jgi:hypothetical protein